jgi:aminopeptidase N
MRVYTRKDKIDQSEYQEMFNLIRYGIKFYEELFAHQFPFKKYDQVIVPHHKYIAMENAGCVTLGETKYLFPKRKPSHAKLLDFSSAILHELAHMWYGNLVTMKWWNDLWLNESFATYISNVAIEKIPEL